MHADLYMLTDDDVRLIVGALNAHPDKSARALATALHMRALRAPLDAGDLRFALGATSGEAARSEREAGPGTPYGQEMATVRDRLAETLRLMRTR